MSAEEPTTTSTKPYLIRAIYEWILDNGMTPHLVVDADYPGADVPREFVDDGQIVLNIAPGAVRDLTIGNDWTSFNARFSGVVRNVLLPTESVLGIVTRESRQGMVFPEPTYPHTQDDSELPGDTPELRAVESPTRPSAGAKPADKGKGRSGPTLKVVK
jgi:stringent starvation protein B